MVKVDELKVGDKIDYGFYKGVFFSGLTEDKSHAIMKDKNGNEKKVYTNLFEKYAIKVKE